MKSCPINEAYCIGPINSNNLTPADQLSVVGRLNAGMLICRLFDHPDLSPTRKECEAKLAPTPPPITPQN